MRRGSRGIAERHPCVVLRKGPRSAIKEARTSLRLAVRSQRQTTRQFCSHPVLAGTTSLCFDGRSGCRVQAAYGRLDDINVVVTCARCLTLCLPTVLRLPSRGWVSNAYCTGVSQASLVLCPTRTPVPRRPSALAALPQLSPPASFFASFLTLLMDSSPPAPILAVLSAP
jgi:hypothetical protein